MAADEPNDLVRQLRCGNAPQLHELLATRAEEFNLLHIRQLLLNPFCGAEHIEAVAQKRRLTSVYATRVALSRHRKTPEVLTLGLIPGLYWRDLLEIHLDMRLRASARRSAENYLIKRLPRLAVGEKITLARRASNTILGQLCHDPNLRVIQAILENPRLTEQTLLPMIASRQTGPRSLDLVASNPRWGRRYEVRLALCRNPLTPFRAVFDILPELQGHDLASLMEFEELSSVVHRRAVELLEEKTSGKR